MFPFHDRVAEVKSKFIHEGGGNSMIYKICL